jgi:hypothetical protein
MLWLILAALVGNWRYEGFASDPARPTPVVPKPVVPEPVVPKPVVPEPVVPEPVVPEPVAPEPIAPESPAEEPQAPLPLPASPVGVDDRPVPTAGAPAPAPSVPKSMPPRLLIKPQAPVRPAPVSWRLVDVRGQVWEHADRDWLRHWVAHRNASLTGYWITPWYEPVPAPADGPCPSGRCPRPH